MCNSEQKKENNKPKEDENSNFICNLLKGAVGVFIVVILLFVGINIWGGKFFNEENTMLSNLGTIGDYFGGLINPLLGFVSFCALLYTIQIQMKSLAKQSEELELTREELRATKEELARSALAQEQSSAIFKQQQFETTFFSLLNYLDITITSLHDSERDNLYEYSYARTLLAQLHTKFNYRYHEIDFYIKKEKERFFLQFGSFITQVGDILNFVNTYDKDNDIYINLIKSKLNQDLLCILFFCYYDDCDINLSVGKKLVEKFSIFEKLYFFYDMQQLHIIFSLYLLKDKYSENAFLNNRSLEKIPAENEFSEFKRAYYNHAN